MSNPTITFRLSIYQLARGLQIIRNLEPDYQLTSIHKIVKTLYIDYLAKMSINKDIKVPQHFIDEVEFLVYKTKKPIKNLNDFQQTEKSIKTNVEDFRPPKTWEK